MVHTHLPRNCVVFLLLCKLTQSAIYGSQKQWPTVLVDECESDQPCRLTPSLVVLLHPAAIHLVGIAGKMQEKTFFETYKLATRTCMYMYFACVFTLCIKANSASIDVTKGVGGVNPLNNFIYFFNIQIVTNNYLNKLFYCYLFIYP